VLEAAPPAAEVWWSGPEEQERIEYRSACERGTFPRAPDHLEESGVSGEVLEALKRLLPATVCGRERSTESVPHVRGDGAAVTRRSANLTAVAASAWVLCGEVALEACRD